MRGGVPVGAISPDGHFNFSACYTHNYREFMGGFTDWVEQIAERKEALDYRKKVSDPESASMWQSLSFGANYKAAYCLSVCPAGEEVIGPYLTDKAGHLREVVARCKKRKRRSTPSPARTPKSMWPAASPQDDQAGGQRPAAPVDPALPVGTGAHVSAGEGGEPERRLPLHLHRQGRETGDRLDPGRRVEGQEGHQGEADLSVTADSGTWLGFLAKERSLLWALLGRASASRGRRICW